MTNEEIIKVAKENDLEPAIVKAVAVVESSGSGFFSNGKPKILFEAHIFWGQLKQQGLDPNFYLPGNENILSPTWNKALYKRGIQEYDRLQQAIKINQTTALKSASWGMFQIMGFNHKFCGFDSVEAFVEHMEVNESNHLECFIEFCKSQNLISYLKAKNWAGFAYRYNGSKYTENSYDIKLAKAYNDNLNLNSL